jgi:hypothetical protein
MKTEKSNKGTNRYQGMTRRQYKQMKAKTNSCRGKDKSINCQATPLDKALTKYPRSIKTSPDEYFEMNLKNDLYNKRNSFFTRNQ